MRTPILALTLTAFGLAAAGAQAPVPTRLTVHVVARDAKLIGSAVGGAKVTVRDVATGRLLAEGLHTGGTGDTRLIMQTPHARGAEQFNTAGAAIWTGTVSLAAPTEVEIAAEGPLDYPQATVSASRRTLLLPGQHVERDGFVLELAGFIVEHVEIDAPRAAGTVPVTARVRMLCSCPTGPGQLWSAGTVTARLLDGTDVVGPATLEYAGEPSTYRGNFTDVKAGTHALQITASDPEAGNFGRWRGDIVVR